MQRTKGGGCICLSDLKPAGKVFPKNGSAQECLEPNLYLDTEKVSKENTTYSRPKYCVPDIVHGVSTLSSLLASDLVNPAPKTYFEQRALQKQEQVYESNFSPIGKPRTLRASVNDSKPDKNTIFGEVTFKEEILPGKIINPPKLHKQVMEEANIGHENYVKTHNDYYVGEMIDRKYDWNKGNPKTTRFGIETPHRNDGLNLKQTLTWLHKKTPDRETALVSKRADDFFERTQPVLGKVHDPIADTLKVGPDHTHGILVMPDEFGVGDLLHMRKPENYLLTADRERGFVATIRSQLKKANYHNFNDLHSAFKYYDYDQSGYLDAKKLKEACWKFNLPIDNRLLFSLMQYCATENSDSDKDKECKINYEKFVNFLNWKDKSFAPKIQPHLISSEAYMPPTVDNDQVKRLQKQIDKAMTDHLTSSSMIDSVVGGIKCANERTYGVPTIRSDLPAPRMRRNGDRKNYGDEYDALGLMNPSIYTQHGVYECDFFQLRSKQEIRDIFEKIGVDMTDEMFEKLWSLAIEWTKLHAKGATDQEASVEAFRAVLDKIQAASLKDIRLQDPENVNKN